MFRVVRALVHVYLIDSVQSEQSLDLRTLEDVSCVLLEKIKAFSFVMRILIFFMVILFDWIGIFYGGRRFSSQSFMNQQRMIHACTEHPVMPIRDFLRFFQKMSLFIYYALLAEAKK